MDLEITCNVPMPYWLVAKIARSCPSTMLLSDHIASALLFAADHKEDWCHDTSRIPAATTPSPSS